MALSGRFETTYYKTERWYEFIWNATQSGNRSTVNWEVYARGGVGIYLTLWSLFLDLTVSKGKLISSSTTVVADKLGSGGTQGGQQYFANNGQGKLSDTAAELYHLDYVYSTAKNRLPYTDCLLAKGTFVIEHTTSGDGAFSVSLKTASPNTTTYQTGSGSYALDPTAILSTISVSGSPKMGETPVFTITKYENGASHSLRYELKNRTGTVVKSGNIASGVDTQYSGWTIPKDFANSITDSDYGTMVVYCGLVLNGVQIGEKSCEWKCYVPDDAYPSVSITISDGAGYFEKVGKFLQNYSRVMVTATTQIAYGSQIASIKTTVNGTTYTGSPLQMPALSPGDYQIVTTVTDGRGRHANATQEITVAAYQIPTMNLSAYRCKSSINSERDDDGEWACITVAGNITQLDGKNTGTLSLEVTGYSESFAGLSGSFTKSVIVAANSSIAHSISARLEDTAGAVPATASIMLQAGFAIMEIYRDGHGISFGEGCEGPGFWVAMDATFRKAVVLANDPVDSTHAVNKGYVDTNTIPQRCAYISDPVSADTITAPFVLLNISEENTVLRSLLGGANFAYIQTQCYHAASGWRLQMAFSYAINPPKMAFRTEYEGVWSAWASPVTTTG